MNDIKFPFSTKKQIKLSYATELFQALKADGDKPKNLITFAELEGIHPADTFEDFIKANQMITYEDIVR